MASSSSQTYYEMLGITQDAPYEEIKRVCIKLVREYHPDKGGTKEQFVEFYKARETLLDVDERSAYDAQLKREKERKHPEEQERMKHSPSINICWHFNKPGGCRLGSACNFKHIFNTGHTHHASYPPYTSGATSSRTCVNCGKSHPIHLECFRHCTQCKEEHYGPCKCKTCNKHHREVCDKMMCPQCSVLIFKHQHIQHNTLCPKRYKIVTGSIRTDVMNFKAEHQQNVPNSIRETALYSELIEMLQKYQWPTEYQISTLSGIDKSDKIPTHEKFLFICDFALRNPDVTLA